MGKSKVIKNLVKFTIFCLLFFIQNTAFAQNIAKEIITKIHQASENQHLVRCSKITSHSIPSYYNFWFSDEQGIKDNCIDNHFSLFLDRGSFSARVSLSESEQIYKIFYGDYTWQGLQIIFNFQSGKFHKPTLTYEGIAFTDADTNYYYLPIETDSFCVEKNNITQWHYPTEKATYQRLVFVDDAYLDKNSHFILRYDEQVYEPNRKKPNNSPLNTIDCYVFKTTDTNFNLKIAAKGKISQSVLLKSKGKFVMKFFYNPIEIDSFQAKAHISSRIAKYADIFTLSLKNWDFLLPNSVIYLQNTPMNTPISGIVAPSTYIPK